MCVFPSVNSLHILFFRNCRCEAPDFACDLTIQPGSTCTCDPVTGMDTCIKYSACVKTPCRNCSDCLAQFTPFARAQEFNQDTAAVKSALQLFCANGGYGQAACANLLADTRLTLNGAKRAGLICTILNRCNQTLLSSASGCELKPPAQMNGAVIIANVSSTDKQVDLCKMEGTTAGKDLAGTSSTTKPPKTCETATASTDCDAATEDCNMASPQTYSKCAPNFGIDTASQLGRCTLKPAVACKQCLDAFDTWVGTPSTQDPNVAPEWLAGAFATYCTGTAGFLSASCASAAQSIAASFGGNAGRRAGPICMLLGQCNTTALASTTITLASAASGVFSRCTKTGVVSGAVVTGFPTTLDTTGITSVCRQVHF